MAAFSDVISHGNAVIRGNINAPGGLETEAQVEREQIRESCIGNTCESIRSRRLCSYIFVVTGTAVVDTAWESQLVGRDPPVPVIIVLTSTIIINISML